MNLFSSHISPRIILFSSDAQEFEAWSSAFRTVGLRIISPKLGRQVNYNLEKDLVLILDSASPEIVQKVIGGLNGNTRNLYVISNDVYWFELHKRVHFNLLSNETHPLETARLVMHSVKVNSKNIFTRYVSWFNF